MSKSILITGGIGDFLAIESFMTNLEKESLNQIFLATRAYKIIEELCRCKNIFPNLESINTLWTDFSNFFAFHRKEEVIEKLAKHTNKMAGMLEKSKIQRMKLLFNDIKDFSIAKIFIQIPNYRHYNESGFIKNQLININEFNLNFDYFIICPYTTNDKRIKTRDFSKKDWDNTIKYLNTNKIKGVVLNIGEDPVPEESNIINFSNKTNFLQSVEILKKAKGYIGIDSSLSVLAAKLFNHPNLIIKSNNGHCYSNKHIYYTPQKKWNFLKNSIQW